MQKKFVKGDIIFIKHLNGDGKLNRHPLVITHFDNESIRAVDQRALFAAVTMSDAKSEYSKNLLKKAPLEEVYVPKEINPSPSGKDGVMQVDVLHLFSEDVLPRDLKGHLPEELVDKAIKVFERLEEAGKAKFNILNLTEVIHDDIEIDKKNSSL